MKKYIECKVLIVDDTEADIDILVEALGDEYDISVAMDGESAFENIDEEVPDIILLDIMMSGMDGYEVCSRIKENKITAKIPIIFLTAMTDINSKAKAFELGAVDYITKPFEILEIKARVNTHLCLRLAQNELLRQNEILEEKVIERTKKISLIQEAIIEAMACLAEYRDPETGAHIKRTKNYVKILCEELRKKQNFKNILNDNVIESIYKSAPLHDIGKIGIRDDILLKNGKLTDEEFNEMKKHTVLGYDFLVKVAEKFDDNSFLKCAIELARSHQEKWDGSGYPDGLIGKEIPLSGRIMAVADVYDAFASKRLYKSAFPHEKVVEIIVQGRLQHFDPEIVDAFINVQEEFRKIAYKYNNFEE
ncbi:HD-GYP domain-containing protein [Clostridium sp. JS66]|uniref:HD-GYP domain-containing protein n=1 Tax=Clostridium sp. JS66 TaxID=3064705 RepID=UPI00298D94F9|nr:HD domain-containing phosphohydrolase [Clostridium sp. JS66]WPC44328.1 response regulator [Clostridium sp. JS66]